MLIFGTNIQIHLNSSNWRLIFDLLGVSGVLNLLIFSSDGLFHEIDLKKSI